ncbi:hypothetical protein Dimus_028138 [Dionaea muscipula]
MISVEKYIDQTGGLIGTTECATLLHSFGLRARIVDFDGQKNEYSRHVYGPMDRYVSRRKTDDLEKPYRSHNDFSSSSRKSRSYQVHCNTCGSISANVTGFDELAVCLLVLQFLRNFIFC